MVKIITTVYTTTHSTSVRFGEFGNNSYVELRDALIWLGWLVLGNQFLINTVYTGSA